MAIRVRSHNENAYELANWLETLSEVDCVYYPGLSSHPDHKLAKKQMKNFGGMMSFELVPGIDAERFMKALNLIKPSMSLAGVESTVLSPSTTSHGLLTPEERANQGITDGLIRFSVGIEDCEDLKEDIKQALAQVV